MTVISPDHFNCIILQFEGCGDDERTYFRNMSGQWEQPVYGEMTPIVCFPKKAVELEAAYQETLKTGQPGDGFHINYTAPAPPEPPAPDPVTDPRGHAFHLEATKIGEKLSSRLIGWGKS